jgi:K+-sensing histidine kinase KdpD
MTSVPSFNPHSETKLRLLWSYGIAVLSVSVTLLIAQWPVLHLEFAPVSLFLCAVMLSAWFGGVGPGPLATILSAAVFYYSFLPPVDSFAVKSGQIPRFVVFVASAVLVGSLSAAQRRATEKL